MKTYTLLKTMVLAGAGILTSCTTQPKSETLKVSASIRPESSLSGRIHQEVNNYRRSKGSTALPRHPGLDRLAQQHCEYLRNNSGKFSLYGKNVSHYGFEGRAVVAREKYQMRNVSENVAATTGGGSTNAPAMLVRLWTNSRDHEHNMSDSWTYTGIGSIVTEDGSVIATQLFATYNPSQMTMTERFREF
jgi:uncharacterized protein YkwD